MIQRIIFFCCIIVLPLILNNNRECYTATEDLKESLNIAQRNNSCMVIPAGDYYIDFNSGSYLHVNKDEFEIHGAGVGKTILHTIPRQLNSNIYIVDFHGYNQKIDNLTIDMSVDYTSPISKSFSTGAIEINHEATYTTVDHIEIYGGYSASLSGGFGIGTYRVWNEDNGNQYATISNNYIHQLHGSCIGIPSNHNLIKNNTLIDCGDNRLQHGFYAQGGYNRYENNVVIRAAGYSFHGWKQTPSLDTSGDQWINNTSIDPKEGHLVVSGITNVNNPNFPKDGFMCREVTIIGNTFVGKPSVMWWIDSNIHVTMGQNVFQ